MLLSFLTTTLVLGSIVSFVSSNRIVTLNATRDTSILFSEDDSQYEIWNTGSSTGLIVGVEMIDTVGVEFPATFRSLVGFNLRSLQGQRIIEANFSLSLRISSDSCADGCGTLHALTTAWTEGSNFFVNASNGEATWLHNMFPSEWNSPGGDFVAEPMGLPMSNHNFATFELNVETLQAMADGVMENNGFILIAPENSFEFYAAEASSCARSTSDFCGRNRAPQLSILLAPSPGSPTASPTMTPLPSDVVVNASMDTSIIFSQIDDRLEYWNVGASTNLLVGQASSTAQGIMDRDTVWRSLLWFDLSGLRGSEVTQVQMVLSLRDRTFGCSSELPGEIGCPTVHQMATPWLSGRGFFENVTSGESSWLHSSFPSQWSTAGGDFFNSVVGHESSELSDAITAVFPLDVGTLQRMIDDSSQNLGFLLKDDDNSLGFAAFESVGCRVRDDIPESCPRNQIPRLEISLAVPTASPTNVPTLSPSISPTQLPTEKPIDRSTLLETCEDFRQTLLVPSESLSSTIELRGFMDVFERETEGLSNMYIVDSTALTTVVELSPLTLSGVEGAALKTAELSFSICYQQPLSIAGDQRIVDMYPEQFLRFMNDASNRMMFENALIAAGIELQQSSLSAATVELSVVQSREQGRDNLGVIIGASVGGVVSVAMVAFFVYRYKRRQRGIDFSKGTGKTTSAMSPDALPPQMQVSAPVQEMVTEPRIVASEVPGATPGVIHVNREAYEDEDFNATF